MRLRDKERDGARLKRSESRKVTLGRIEFFCVAVAFSASHLSAADITGVQERVQLGSGKVEFCLPTKLQVPRANISYVHARHLMNALNAFGLFARVNNFPSRQCDRDVYARQVGDLRHRITVRLTDAHASHLENLAGASGLTRNEVMRRVLLNVEVPSARARQEVQDILRIQREQNRLGGLLKKALTEREEKAELRRTLVEVERNGAELRRVLAHLVRSR